MSAPPATRHGHRADVVAGCVVVLLVAAAVAGCLWWNPGRRLGPGAFAGAGPRFGEWPVLGTLLPHAGPATVTTVLFAVAVVFYGPGLAERLPWHRALAAAYGGAVAWTFSLALIDGWQTGIAGRLTASGEYLAEVPHITDIGVMLRTFTGRILDFQPDSWPTHVSGHPPAATLVFVWLDRIGLGGGGIAGVVCILAGAAAAVAVPVTISALGHRDLARAAIPFLVLFPGAVWVGVSADGLFTGVTTTGIALLALGATGRLAWAVAGGVVLGFGIFLSYGLVLLGAIALAVVLAARRWAALALALAGALAVVLVFAAAGFWWPAGYHLVVERYYQGIATQRPYGYWVWADLACLALATGPVAGPGLRRAWLSRRTGLTAVLAGAAVAVLASDVSGLSKAEVERIWLPFGVWLVAAAAFLPCSSRRWWLAAQAVTALAVNSILVTNW
ncbi:hypothetical protein GKO32_27160 [Amycolatopsis sp. RM579]|uniref:DUF2029 domain-containing protein n=1 Tax=Amycolatopsis pithecellobii TaxID=664692 RepID=A0A6N7Z906_9PSEU|nr:hypothetical protein [Amycolatopsis pithecellobii]